MSRRPRLVLRRAALAAVSERQYRTCDAEGYFAAAIPNVCRPCIEASHRECQNREVWSVCRLLFLLRKKPHFGSFPLLGYLEPYRKLLSASYGVLLYPS
jgi:hypothetical protein